MTLRQREPRVEDKAFLAFLRGKPCCACGHPPPVQAAHIRMASFAHRKREVGKSEKPHDSWAIPLCAWCHLDGPYALHKIGEAKFWRAGLTGPIDPFAIAKGLYAEFLASGVSRLKRGAHSGRKSKVSRPLLQR